MTDKDDRGDRKEKIRKISVSREMGTIVNTTISKWKAQPHRHQRTVPEDDGGSPSPVLFFTYCMFPCSGMWSQREQGMSWKWQEHDRANYLSSYSIAWCPEFELHKRQKIRVSSPWTPTTFPSKPAPLGLHTVSENKKKTIAANNANLGDQRTSFCW